MVQFVRKILFLIKSIFIVIVLTTLLSAPLFCWSGVESLQFLKIKPSARANTLGDGFVSVANDASAAFYNPAGLWQLDRVEVSLMHMAYLMETSYEFGAVSVPLGDKFRVGVYAVYLNYGSIIKTSEYLPTGEYFSPYDFAGALSLGYKLSDSFSVGVNFKIALSDVDGSSLTNYLGDLGLLYKLSEEVSVGAATYNVGCGGEGGPAPISGRLGASMKISLAEPDDLLVVVGANYLRAGGYITGSLGVEYTDSSMLILRAGYGTADADGLNIGIGTKQELGGMTGCFDYNISMLGDMGSTHRLSVGVILGDDESGKQRKKSGNYKKDTKNSIKKRF